MVPGVPGTSGPRTILSVFPKEQVLELRHEGFKTYRMPAAKQGSFETLVVPDTYSWNRNFAADGFQLYAAAIPATAVADNLITRWSTSMVGTKDGLGPGVLICKGAEPTEEEIAAVNARQQDYFRFLVNEADALFAQDNIKDITDTHRMAAEWMGTQDRPWCKLTVRVEMRPCPACGESIRAGYDYCKHCHTSTEEYLAKRAKKVVGSVTSPVAPIVQKAQ